MLKIKFIYYLTIIFLLFGCKKYTEGGRLGGLTGTEDRIAGDYAISSFTVNGHDSLSALTSNTGYCTGLKIKFEQRDGKSNIVTPSCGSAPLNFWKVSDDRKNVQIVSTTTTGAASLSYIVSNQDLTLTWEIQRLTKKDFWITTSYNNDEYYLKLSR